MDSRFSRQCEGKRQFDEEEANETAKFMHKRHKKKFNAYQCLECGKFHVGGDRSREAAIRRSERA